MKTRAERMKEAAERIREIEEAPIYKALTTKLNQAQSDLAEATRSFDIGENVIGEESIGSGCDTDYESFSGVIIGTTLVFQSTKYIVRISSGRTIECFSFQLKRT